MIRLAIIGPAVKTTKPKSQGLRNAKAAHVSREANPANQSRALTRGPGLVAVAVAIRRPLVVLLGRGLDRRDRLLLCLVERLLRRLLTGQNASDRVVPSLLELGARRRGRD